MIGDTPFVRLITMKVKRGKGDSFARMFRKDIAAPSAHLEGLRRIYLLRSVDKRDDFVVMSLWNTRKDAERYVAGDKFDQNAIKLARFLRTKQTTSKFVVQTHVVGDAAKPKGP